jgi:mono/diheme cytochrome c family protein
MIANPTNSICRLAIFPILVGATCASAQFVAETDKEAPSKVPQPDLAAFQQEIAPVLQKTCVQCHGPEKQKGKFRVDTLDPDLQHGGDVKWWLEIFEVVSNSEMPPEDDEVILPDTDRAKMIDWLSSEIQVASEVSRAEEGHSSFRRMTRYEYTYTLQDLLGLPYDFGKDLPPETTSEDGFKNSSELLKMSTMQFEYYRTLSRDALKKATVTGDLTPVMYYRTSMKDWAARIEERYQGQRNKEKKKPNPDYTKIEKNREVTPLTQALRHLKTGKAIPANGEYGRITPTDVLPGFSAADQEFAAILPASPSATRFQKMSITLGSGLPDAGTLRVRVRASRDSADNPRIPSLRLTFGFGSGNNAKIDVKVSDISIDAKPGAPQIYQWDVPLYDVPRNPYRDSIRPGGKRSNGFRGNGGDERITLSNVYPAPRNSGKGAGSAESFPAIRIDSVEIAGPVYTQWPPESHTRIFFDSRNREDETRYAREILSAFMPNAWRRPTNDDEVGRMLALFAKLRPQCDTFQDAMIEVLSVVLASPNFLYLVQADPPGEEKGHGPLSNYELASRLSYFLWSSMPDRELIDLARNGKLNDPEVLAAQTKRMLEDPRSERFSKRFVHQWLGMHLLDFLDVDTQEHPQYDAALKESMRGEIETFFTKILRNNHSMMDFLDAEYVMVDHRLARHYGLAEVQGNHFRKVALGPEDHRGGLLTQAGLLAMNSDGKDSHPLKRGIWLLERLLNDPPPPPPPAVPEIDLADPEIAKLTLKQRLE